MIRIAIDGVGAKEGGGGAILREVTSAVLRRDDVASVCVFCSPREHRSFSLDGNPRMEIIEVPAAERGAISRVDWLVNGLARYCRRERADVVLALSGAGLVSAIPVIPFIQQALPFFKEGRDTFPWDRRLRLDVIRWLMQRSSRHAHRIIVQTFVMREALVRQFGLRPQSISVLTPGPEKANGTTGAPELEVLRRAPVGRRVLYVGSAMPYKNLGVLAPAVDRLRKTLPDAWVFATVPPGTTLPNREGVMCLGPLDSSVVREAYSLASCLVLPSLVETVGLPILEAFAAGLPVAVSDRPYAREVCGEAACFFDPASPGDVAAAIERVLLDQELRAGLVAQGHARVERFASSKPYDQIADLLVQAATTARHGIRPQG